MRAAQLQPECMVRRRSLRCRSVCHRHAIAAHCLPSIPLAQLAPAAYQLFSTPTYGQCWKHSVDRAAVCVCCCFLWRRTKCNVEPSQDGQVVAYAVCMFFFLFFIWMCLQSLTEWHAQRNATGIPFGFRCFASISMRTVSIEVCNVWIVWGEEVFEVFCMLEKSVHGWQSHFCMIFYGTL